MKLNDLFITEAPAPRRRVSLKGAANRVAQNLVDRYGYYSDDKPVVQQVDRDTFSVSWNGPSDWPTNDTYGFHEEIAGDIAEFGGETAFDADSYKPYFDEIPGYYMEPNTGYELHISRD
jgi:hypothetical protein